MNVTDLATQTAAQLAKQASDLKIPGRSKMRKADLIAAIEAAAPRAERPTDSEALAELAARIGHTTLCVQIAHDTLMDSGIPDFDEAKARIEQALDEGDCTCRCLDFEDAPVSGEGQDDEDYCPLPEPEAWGPCGADLGPLGRCVALYGHAGDHVPPTSSTTLAAMVRTRQPLPADGSPLVKDVTGTTYRVCLIPAVDGYTVTVRQGTHEVEGLTDGITDETMARDYASRLVVALRDGVTPAQLVADREAARHGLDDALREILASPAATATTRAELVQTTMGGEGGSGPLDGDTPDPARRDINWGRHGNDAKALRDDLKALAGDGSGWRREREAAQQAARYAASAGSYRAVRANRTQTHLRDLTEPQKRILAGARDGVVYCGRGTGVSPLTLRALHDKVGGDLLPNGITRYGIAGLRLTAAVIEQLAVAA